MRGAGIQSPMIWRSRPSRHPVHQLAKLQRMAADLKTVTQRGDQFDVYGCYRKKLGWYVKIGESFDGLLVISHHAPAHALTTTVGRLITDMEP